MTGPGPHGEDVPLLPVIALPIDHTEAVSVQHEVHTTAGVAMGLRVDRRAQELRRTAQRREYWPPSIGVGVDQKKIVTGRRCRLWQRR